MRYRSYLTQREGAHVAQNVGPYLISSHLILSYLTQRKRTHIPQDVAPYLVLSVDHVSDITSEAWYRLMSTSKVTGETKIVKLPENMLSHYEELL